MNSFLLASRVIRECVDYRKPNLSAQKDHFSLPFMDQILERLVGESFIAFLMDIIDIVINQFLTFYFNYFIYRKNDEKMTKKQVKIK